MPPADGEVIEETAESDTEDDNNNRERLLKRAISSDCCSDDSWCDDYDPYADDLVSFARSYCCKYSGISIN